MLNESEPEFESGDEDDYSNPEIAAEKTDGTQVLSLTTVVTVR